MNAQEFRSNLLIKRPRHAKSRISLFEALANKGNINSDYSQFGPYYELYIYAFTLGLKMNLKLDLPDRRQTQDFGNGLGDWKRGTGLVDFLLMVVFSRADEIGFNWNELEDMEEKELNEVISNIISFIESYANGGLKYLDDLRMENKLDNTHYMFIDLMLENSNLDFSDVQEIQSKVLIVEETDPEYESATLALINSGESQKVEFKSTLRVNLHTNNIDQKMELMCLKTIAAFMNSNGGSLMIGVSDAQEILGLETDFNSFSKSDDLVDEFQKHFDNLIEKYLGNSVHSLLSISFPVIEDTMICRVNVKRKKNGPIFLKDKGKEELFIRRAASSKALNGSEILEYKETHWG